MAIKIPRGLVEAILLGPLGDRRQLQDSPILADVWIAFAEEPDKPKELLITPDKSQTAGSVAIELDECIFADRNRKDAPTSRKGELAHFAYLQGVVAAKLYFDELLRVIVPRTTWWVSRRNRKEIEAYEEAEAGQKKLLDVLACAQKMALYWSEPGKHRKVAVPTSGFDRYAAIAGFILWAAQPETQVVKDAATSDNEAIAHAIETAIPRIAELLASLFNAILSAEGARDGKKPAEKGRSRKGKKDDKKDEPLVYQVSLNRDVSVAIARSVGAVKADAAHSLFKVSCCEIGWAVLDSGIDASHPAFADADGEPRVKASFDFSTYREIVSLDNLRIFRSGGEELKKQKLAKLLHDNLMNKPEDNAIVYLTTLAEDVKNKRPIHWELVEPFIQIKPTTRPPVSDHGTHVAGIIGASKDGPESMAEAKKKAAPDKDSRADYVDGMCPDIQLYDFRVLSDATKEARDTEFAVIAALQYIRHMNARHDYVTIHGANLSLSIQHDVHNFACGRTPVCEESEKLVSSGVVVVAAAGNYGYQSYVTKEGSYEGYAAASITDPGNADGVITVGATHRYSPHTYGVSFFSSRGPTGDGRSKPDLVAPGERIHAPFRDGGWDDLDGTSMAAPHVSGAAAMLMARYSELIGQPRRIKEILCRSATDLGRERNFQGHGMLDVLRAFQSI